jgi:hypothetical protein
MIELYTSTRMEHGNENSENFCRLEFFMESFYMAMFLVLLSDLVVLYEPC